MAIFTNQATLTYNNRVTNSNVVTGEIVDSITATKTAVSSDYSADGTVTYVISLVNTGSTAITGITVTDNLGAYAFGTETLVPLTYQSGTVRYYVNGVAQATPTVTANGTLVISGITVPAGGNAILVYSTKANSFAPLAAGSTILNTATVTASGISTPITATETVAATNAAELAITKAISPQTVTDNSEITYTFTVSNYGSTAITATDNAVITDVFDPVLSNLAVTFNGTAWAETTNYTYDRTTGTFATLAGQLTVPAATFTQNATTGEWTVQPGTALLTVTGTISQG